MEPREGAAELQAAGRGFTPEMGHLADRYRGCCAQNWVLERTPGTAFRDPEPKSKARSHQGDGETATRTQMQGWQ